MDKTNELLFKTIRCCLNEYNHIVDKSVVILNCSGNACKTCINDSNEDFIYCYNCNNKHNKHDIIKCPPNTSVLLLINSCSKEIIESLNTKIGQTVGLLKGIFKSKLIPFFHKLVVILRKDGSIVNEMKIKQKAIESVIDEKCEQMVQEIRNISMKIKIQSKKNEDNLNKYKIRFKAFCDKILINILLFLQAIAKYFTFKR